MLIKRLLREDNPITQFRKLGTEFSDLVPWGRQLLVHISSEGSDHVENSLVSLYVWDVGEKWVRHVLKDVRLFIG